MKQQLAAPLENWQVGIEFRASLHVVQQKIPAGYGTITPTPNGVLFQGAIDDLDYMARYLTALNLPFVVREPLELRDALLRLAAQITESARAG